MPLEAWGRKKKWTWGDSHPRHLACKASALLLPLFCVFAMAKISKTKLSYKPVD